MIQCAHISIEGPRFVNRTPAFPAGWWIMATAEYDGKFYDASQFLEEEPTLEEAQMIREVALAALHLAIG